MAISQTRAGHTALPWIVLAAAVLQAAAPVASYFGLGAEPGDTDVELDISPAGYAFSIWGLIYFLAIALAVAAVVKKTTGTAEESRLQIDLTIAYLAAAAWIFASAAGNSTLTALLLTLMAVALVDAVLVAARPKQSAGGEDTGWVTTLARASIGSYAAWVTVAVFLNLASAAVSFGWVSDNDLNWQVAVLAVAALTCLTVTWLVAPTTPVYPATLVWAFIAVVVAAWGGSTVVVVTTVVALIAVVAVTLWRRRR